MDDSETRPMTSIKTIIVILVALSTCSCSNNKKVELKGGGVHQLIENAEVNSCIPEKLKHLSEIILKGDNYELSDSFCAKYYTIQHWKNDSIGYYFSGYLVRPVISDVKFGIGMYNLNKSKNKAIFFDFFKKSGVVKAPMIFIEENGFIYNISTPLPQDKGKLVKFFREKEERILRNFSNDKVVFVNCKG